jgi:hypothetical protein
MKSFEKFNVEAMVHHIAVPAAKAALTGVGAWAAYNAAKKLMPQQRQQTPAVDYGQGGDSFAAKVTRGKDTPLSPNAPAGQPSDAGARAREALNKPKPKPEPPKPKPEPPKPPKTEPPKPPGPIKKAVTAVGGATAGAASLSGNKRVGGPDTKPAVPTPDPEDSKPKPEPPKPKSAIPTGQEPKPKPAPRPAAPTNTQGFRSGPFTYTPPASPRERSYQIRPRTR